MQIVLATSNQGKIKEFEKLLPNDELIPYTKLLGDDIQIVEDGDSFKANAIIKAKKVSSLLNDENILVLADDSGISVDLLDGQPGIYSARYSGANATSISNIKKLISKLKEKKLKKSSAFYTACIAISYKGHIYTVHGFMYGEVIDEIRGDKGFGYDPIFIPKGYDKTLGQLDYSVKHSFSHRTKALLLAKNIIDNL